MEGNGITTNLWSGMTVTRLDFYHMFDWNLGFFIIIHCENFICLLLVLVSVYCLTVKRIFISTIYAIARNLNCVSWLGQKYDLRPGGYHWFSCWTIELLSYLLSITFSPPSGEVRNGMLESIINQDRLQTPTGLPGGFRFLGGTGYISVVLKTIIDLYKKWKLTG